MSILLSLLFAIHFLIHVRLSIHFPHLSAVPLRPSCRCCLMIGPGPNKPSVTPIDAWTFLMLCRTRFPKAIISIGWTTQLDEVSLKIGYTREMVDQMAGLVKGEYLDPERFTSSPVVCPNRHPLSSCFCRIQSVAAGHLPSERRPSQNLNRGAAATPVPCEYQEPNLL